MRQDHRGDGGCIESEKPQRLTGPAQQRPASCSACLQSEARVDEDDLIRAPKYPNVVVEIGALFVQIGADRVVARTAAAMRGVFERGDPKGLGSGRRSERSWLSVCGMFVLRKSGGLRREHRRALNLGCAMA